MLHHLHSMVFAALTSLVLVQPASWAQTSDFRLGTAVAASQAERSIAITADTRWANVRQGETIRFSIGQTEFGWKFDGSAQSFDLMRVAPAGSLSRPLMVYVMPGTNGRRAN
jgi:hypothetical protein